MTGMTDDEYINMELDAEAAQTAKEASSHTGLIGGNPPVANEPGATVRRDMSVSQWGVLPNESYAPASSTIRTLPSAAYNIAQDNNGNLFLRKQTLLSDNIIQLPDSVSQKAVSRVRKFWQSKDRYASHGLLHRTGVLFYGPPGSGKSCTIQLIVTEMISMDGIALFCNVPGWMKNMLVTIRTIESERPLIVVLEDMDEIIRTYGESEVLSVLDGENRVSNTVFLATTNYIGKLGARIVNRPARFDERIRIDMPSLRDRTAYLKHTAVDLNDYQLTCWAEDTNGLSIAHLRELVAAVLCLEQPYAEVLARLKTMMHVPKEEDNEGFGAKGTMGLAPTPSVRTNGANGAGFRFP